MLLNGIDWLAIVLFFPELRPWQQLLIVMGVTTFAWVTVTLLTPPTDAVKRAAFQNRIYGRTTLAVTMTVIAAVSGIGLFPILRQLNTNQTIKQS